MESEVTQQSPPSDVAVIAKALHEVMKAVGYVKKDKSNDFSKYRYASEEALLSALRPALIEAGLILVPDCEDPPVATPNRDGKGETVSLRMSYRLVHVSGAIWPFPFRVPGCGHDSLDKGVYKAMTGANKYALMKLLQLATGDDEQKAERMNAAGERAARAAHDDGGLRNGELLGAIEAIGRDAKELKAWWDRVLAVVHESERGPYREAWSNRCAALGIQPGVLATKGILRDVQKREQRGDNGAQPGMLS